MVRWRYCLFLAMLLVLPDRISSQRSKSKLDDDEEESESGQAPSRSGKSSDGYKRLRKTFPSRRVEEVEEEDEDDDDDDDEPSSEKMEHVPAAAGRRAPALVPQTTLSTAETVTRTVPRRPLECYVCAFKAETQLRSCLDPTKYRVHTMICHSADDKCFTSVISKGNTYEAVMRGCRSGCVGSPETTCCELNRCNNQALAVPVVSPHVLAAAHSAANKSNKAIPPSVLFFVTILLVLQTVVKVAFV